MFSKARTMSLIAAMLLVAAGCGSDDESNGATAGDSGGQTVTVGVALDASGPSGFAGVLGRKGLDLAVKEVNDKDLIGGKTKLVLDIQDTATDPKQAATTMQKFVQNNDIVAAIAGPASATALGAAPVALRGKLPLDIYEGAAPGSVQLGDWIFRSSAPQDSYHSRLMDYLSDKGYKTVFQVYNNDIPTNLNLGTKVWPREVSRHGLKIVGSQPISNTSTNFGTIAAKAKASGADVVMNHLNGPQIVALIAALKRVGYSGELAGGVGSCCGVLKPAGRNANGLIYTAAFHPDVDTAGAKAFTERYRIEYQNQDPDVWQAGSWDAVMFVAQSLKNASGDYSRASVKRGMQATADAGMPEAAAGAMTFEQRDARIKGLVLEWNDGKSQLAE